MDRFKFRAWFRDRWLHGYEKLGGCSIAGETMIIGGWLSEVKLKDLNEVVIEQCTGRKDKNGKLIYEGDVVNFYHENKRIGSQPYIVVYRDCNYALTLANDDTANFWLGSQHLRCLEVVGNVHDS